MRRRSALVALVALAALFVPAPGSASDFWDAVRTPGLGRHDAELARARLALRARRFEDALGAAQAAVDALPGSAEAHVVRGLAAGELGRRDEAVLDFERALALDPRALDGASDGARAAELAALAGAPSLAAALLDRVLGRMEAGPRRRTLYVLYGDVLQALGPDRLREAIAAYREALREAATDDPRAVLGLALAYHRKGDHDEARRLLGSLAEVDGLEVVITGAAIPPAERAARRALVSWSRGESEAAREALREARRSEVWSAHAEAALRALEREPGER